MAAPLQILPLLSKIMFLRKFAQTVRHSRILKINMQTKNISTAVDNVKLLRRGEESIAYRVMTGNNPGIVFCPGFQSNMMGVKANALEKYCKENSLAYVR